MNKAVTSSNVFWWISSVLAITFFAGIPIGLADTPPIPTKVTSKPSVTTRAPKPVRASAIPRQRLDRYRTQVAKKAGVPRSTSTSSVRYSVRAPHPPSGYSMYHEARHISMFENVARFDPSPTKDAYLTLAWHKYVPDKLYMLVCQLRGPANASFMVKISGTNATSNTAEIPLPPTTNSYNELVTGFYAPTETTYVTLWSSSAQWEYVACQIEVV